MFIRRAAAECAERCRSAIIRWWRACAIEGPRAYAYAVLFLLATLLIVAMGPSLQTYVSTLLTSTEANVYDSAYRDAIQKFPDFAGWLAFTLDPFVIIPSVAIWAAALSSTRARTSLIRSFAAAFVSLTLLDVAIGIVWSITTFEYFATCIGSNLIGGFLIALIVVSMRSAATYIAGYEAQSAATTIIGVCTPVIIGAVISGSVFIAAKTVYDPAPVEFKATVSPKSWGIYRTAMPIDDKLGKSFDLFTGKATEGSVDWTGKSSPFEAKWRTYDAPYDLSVAFSQGCTREDVNDAVLVDPALRLNDVRSLSIELDEGGMSEFGLLPGEPVSLTATDSEIASFSIDQRDKVTEFTMMSGREGKSTHSQAGTKRLFLSGFLLGLDTDKKTLSVSKTISFLVNNTAYAVTFEPNKTPRPGSAAVQCTALHAKMLGRHRITVIADEPMASAVFTLTPKNPDRPLGTDERSNQIKITGANGWLRYRGQASVHTPHDTFSEGQTDFLVISGVFDEFQVSNQAMPTSKENSLQAFGGTTDIRLSDSGVFHISGKVNALYWNQERVNKTRWEKIDAAERTLLLSWVVGLLFLGYKGIRAALGSNYKLGTPT